MSLSIHATIDIIEPLTRNLHNSWLLISMCPPTSTLFSEFVSSKTCPGSWMSKMSYGLIYFNKLTLSVYYITHLSISDQSPISSTNSIHRKKHNMGSSADTICVTGASGFIGSWLIMRLLERGYTVRATVRDPSTCPVLIGWIKFLMILMMFVFV